MQRKLITAAVAAACAAAAAPAFALLPGAFNPATANETYLGGATAQENQILNFMRRACVAGTLDVYRQSNQFLFFCQRNATVVPTGTTNMVVYKTSFGGSGTGVQPVADASVNTNTVFMNIATLTTATQCTGPTLVPAITVAGDPIGLPAYNTWNCSQPTAQRRVEIGFSDVEPKQFGATLAQIGRLTTSPTNVLMFGAPVTLGLRNALQDKEIAAGELAATCDDSTAARETLACMPNLTKSQITALYTGSIDSQTWSDLGVTNAVDNGIYVVRRVDSSGTQTSARIHFLNDPCSLGVSQFLPANNGQLNNLTNPCTATPQAGNVYAGSGSQNVVACMNGHQTAGRWAIGVLSMEFAPARDALGNITEGYRHVKIDGAAPTVLEVARNRYHNWMEATIQWRNLTAPNDPLIVDDGPLAGNDLALGNAFVTGLGNPVVLEAINDAFQHEFCGDKAPSVLNDFQPCSGLLATALSGNTASTPPLTAANVQTNPVATATKSASGAPNNCQFPQVVFPH